MAFVYFIENPIGEIYVGSTTGILKKRLQHYSSLNCKSQPKIYKSLIKYGFNEHKIESISCEDENVRSLELQFILRLNTVHKGLNGLAKGVNNTTSIIKKSINDSTSLVQIFDFKTLSKIGVYKSPLEASLDLGVSNKQFSISIKGRQPYLVLNKYIVYRTNEIINNPSYKLNKGENCYQSKEVFKLDNNGNVLATYYSMKEAGLLNNINYKNISSVCKGRRNFAGGYKWRN